MKGTAMDRREVLVMDAACCVCGRDVDAREPWHAGVMVDDDLCGEAYCSSCAVTHLHLCRECSGRYTADPAGVCVACAVAG